MPTYKGLQQENETLKVSLQPFCVPLFSNTSYFSRAKWWIKDSTGQIYVLYLYC